MLHDVTFMTSILFGLLAALAIGLVTWRVAIARRRSRDEAPKTGQMPAAAEPATAAPAAKASAVDVEAARATARAKAERVVAAEAARRKAAIQKAQNVARVEAERRAAKAAEAAAALATTIPLDSPAVDQPATPAAPPSVAANAPVARKPAAPVAAPSAPTPTAARALETTTPLLRAVPAAPRTPAVAKVLKGVEQTLVMLVDDSKMVRVKSSRLLASHGFQVVTAVDGVDALRQFENCCPDLVITDVDMPEMDGFGLTNALRAGARTQHIPIVMITSAEERHREEALRVGVGLVLGKPYDEAALIAHIRSFKFFAKAEDVETLACA